MVQISVIVPVYNTEKYVKHCIESILNQTYKNIELILVDDGSTDASGKICDRYGEIDDRVTVIHKKNEGVIKARISGVMQSVGEYIAFVDSDDWICEDAYEKTLPYLGEADVVSFGIYRYFSSDNIRLDLSKIPSGKYNQEGIEKKIIPSMLWGMGRNTWEIDPSICAKIVKKEVILPYMRKIENLDIHYGEDVAVVYPMLLNCKSLINVNAGIYYHRQRKNANYPYIEDRYFYDKLYRLYAYLKDEFKKSRYWSLLEGQLSHFYLNAIDLKRRCVYGIKEMEMDVFPYWKVRTDSKIILYGAGKLGKKYKEWNDMYHFCRIVLWVDKTSVLAECDGLRPQSVMCINGVEYDFILIAVKSPLLAKEIKDDLLLRGVTGSKIIWAAVRVFDI